MRRCYPTFRAARRVCQGVRVTEREGDFRDFVAARHGALLRTAFLLTGDHGRAEDLLQVALTNAYLRWRRLDDPEAYVRRSLVNERTSWWRRRRNHEVPHDALPDHAGDDPTRALDLRHAMLAALATLPPRQRAVIVLR